jgi:tetratricopeptide (TPR) repeat protein
MKTSAMLSIFLAGAIFVPMARTQQTGAADSPATAPAPKALSAKEAKAAAMAAQRDADEAMARTDMATKRYAEAATLFEKLAKAYPRDPRYLNLAGIAHMQSGEMRVARAWFQRAVKVEPRFADAYNNVGATYYGEKNFKRALQYYQRAVTLQPGVAAYHTNVGYAYFSMKMAVEAEEAFRRALLMDPLIFQQNGRNGSVLQDRSVEEKGLFAFTMAKSFAGTGDAAHCAGYLRRALDEGYDKMAQVYSDPDFAGVLTDPDVQAVLSLIPAAGAQAALPASP